MSYCKEEDNRVVAQSGETGALRGLSTRPLERKPSHLLWEHNLVPLQHFTHSFFFSFFLNVTLDLLSVPPVIQRGFVLVKIPAAISYAGMQFFSLNFGTVVQHQPGYYTKAIV